MTTDTLNSPIFLKPLSWTARVTRKQLIGSLIALWFLFVVINFLIEPFRLSDFDVWIPLARNFPGEIATNMARHRPLFAFLVYLTYLPFSWIPLEKIPLDLLRKIPLPIIQQTLPKLSAHWLQSPDFFHNAVVALMFRLQNYAAYLGATLFGFFAVEKLTRSAFTAFFFALLVLTSSQLYYWLNDTLINTQGFFVMYASLFLLADYLEAEPNQKRTKLILYSMLHGLLLLGKAQYNILAAILFYAVVFDQKRLKESLAFLFWSTVPLLLWVLLLTTVFHGSYSNYEISHAGGMSVTDKFLMEYGGMKIFSLPGNAIFEGLIAIREGLSTPILISILLAMGYFLPTARGKFMVSYFLATCLFLTGSGFNLTRHAGDYAPIGYLALALLLDTLRKKADRAFWPTFTAGLTLWSALNLGAIRAWVMHWP